MSSQRQDAPATPRATMRLQLNRAFGFAEAARVVPYLSRLGISHVYASPILTARPGSSHGYDIIDHASLNPELGSAADFDRLVDTLADHGMGLIVDFVPNHMGVGGADNAWWLDVLEWGKASPFANFFDIDWAPIEPSMQGKVLLPFLGASYGSVLESGGLVLDFDETEGSFSVWYHEHRFPLSPWSYPTVLQALKEACDQPPDTLPALISGFKSIPRAPRGVSRLTAARRDCAELKGQLARLVGSERRVKECLGRVIVAFNGKPGSVGSFDRLHQLLEAQCYRLAYWRVAEHEINYRRFFDINGLAGLKIEDGEAFELAHRLIFQLMSEGRIQGIRFDHVDGLADPRAYLARFQERAAYLVPTRAPETGGETVPGLTLPFYALVEKILAGHESLRRDWAVCGTTGYEFLNDVAGLFVDPAGEGPISRTYVRFTGDRRTITERIVENKRTMARSTLSSEVNVVANALNRLAKQSRVTRDFTLSALREALIDIIGHFPVYRTYITSAGASDDDRRDLDWAVAQARKSAQSQDAAVYEFVHAVLSTDLVRWKRGHRRGDIVRAATKFQQVSGPITAKAMEDTAFYQSVRLVSLNEVGGEPERFGVTPSAFHRHNRDRLRYWPFSMVTTATHDHKRGEDTRTRISVLSEVPGEWESRIRRWATLNRFKKRSIEAEAAPSRRDEYLFYQTVLGVWPIAARSLEDVDMPDLAGRVSDYMLKAAREAKDHTSWTIPNEDYETALDRFVRGCLDLRRSRGFLADMHGFATHIAPVAALHGLAQTALKLTVPGVPDIYQGTDLWDQSLVDPDNRRPVAFEDRNRIAKRLQQRKVPPVDLLDEWTDGTIKLRLIQSVLACREAEPGLFSMGDYSPVDAVGTRARNLISFARRTETAAILVVVPRLVTSPVIEVGKPRIPAEYWDDTTLMLPELPGVGEGVEYRDLMTGAPAPVDLRAGHCSVRDLLAQFPMAVITNIC